MPIRSFLLLYRARFAFAAVASVFVALAVLFLTSAESPTDFGVLWHHFCGCPPDPADAGILLNASTFTCFCIGAAMGLGLGAAGGAQANHGNTVPGMVYGEMRFLLTRPMRRTTVLLLPIAISAAAIALFPAAGLLLLLGWLSLVHAPALQHLVDIARLIPGAEAIGPHPSLLTVLSATHYARYYAASVSVGLCIFGIYYVQRWWIHSKSKWLRWASLVTFLMPILPGFLFASSPRRMGWLVLISPTMTQPSLLAISLHVLFAAVALASCWRIAQRLEV